MLKQEYMKILTIMEQVNFTFINVKFERQDTFVSKKAEKDAFLVSIYENKAGWKDKESLGDIRRKKRPSFWNLGEAFCLIKNKSCSTINNFLSPFSCQSYKPTIF